MDDQPQVQGPRCDRGHYGQHLCCHSDECRSPADLDEQTTEIKGPGDTTGPQ